MLRELKERHPDVEIRFWCDKGFEAPARALMSNFDDSIQVDTIISGKLRRYHSLPWWRQAARLRTIVWPNIRDGFKVVLGTFQSLLKLVAWRPDVVFTKGGFVCLPIGVAARLLNIPLVIHDSDAHPGLTNRILARWADQILTGAPLEHYSYPKSRSHYVGIPIRVRLDQELPPQELKQKLGLDPSRPLVVCTGGGLGASRINRTVISILPRLLERGCSVVLVTGEKNYQEAVELLGESNPEHVVITPFISGNLHEYFAAADVVVTRAGATTLLELAALSRPTIIIPNIYLTGGHQRKNAAVYTAADAAVVVDEEAMEADPSVLADTIISLVDDDNRRQQLSAAIRTLAKPNAASDTADIIESVIKHKEEKR